MKIFGEYWKHEMEIIIFRIFDNFTHNRELIVVKWSEKKEGKQSVKIKIILDDDVKKMPDCIK